MKDLNLKKIFYKPVDLSFLKIDMHLIITFLKIVIEKNASHFSTLQVRK